MARVTDKSIFYHIPKTGGVWVEKILIDLYDAKDIGIDRSTLSRKIEDSSLFYKHTVPGDIPAKIKAGKFSYTFIRHPISWYKSFWRYRTDRSTTIDHRDALSGCWDKNFNVFLDNVQNAYPDGFVTQLYQYYIGKDGKNLDFIGKTENLKEDLQIALNKAGHKWKEKDLERKPVNVSLTPLPKVDSVLKDRIMEQDKWVIDNYYA